MSRTFLITESARSGGHSFTEAAKDGSETFFYYLGVSSQNVQIVDISTKYFFRSNTPHTAHSFLS